MQPDFATLKPVSASQPDFATLKPVTPVAPISTDQQSSATFPAKPNEGIGTGAAKLVGNIPSSALGFVKGTIDTLNPINIVKNIGSYVSGFDEMTKQNGGDSLKTAIDVIKSFPETVYANLVPKATQQAIAGDFSGARETLTNDPVGQILPYLLSAKGMAEKAGMGTQFDSAISTIAKPVTVPTEAIASKVGSGVGKLASQTLGAATGAGASSIEQAAQHSQAFTDAMRGKINPDEIVQTAQDAVSNIADNRRNSYVSQLDQISQQKGSLDVSPVTETLQSQLKNYGVTTNPDGTLNFSRSSIANNGTARNDIQGVFDTLKTWGTQPGDRTAIGLDTLKKQLGDFYSDSSSARSFVQAVKSKVTGILNEQVSGYQDMTKGYATASGLLDEIKSATGVGNNTKVDTAFSKLTTALKGDKELRLEIMNEMQAKGAQPDLMAKIAGINMQSLIPKGLIGKGIDVGLLLHFFDPKFIPVMLSTSPRIVGEFVRALGMGAEKTKAVLNAINNIPVPKEASVSKNKTK